MQNSNTAFSHVAGLSVLKNRNVWIWSTTGDNPRFFFSLLAGWAWVYCILCILAKGPSSFLPTLTCSSEVLGFILVTVVILHFTPMSPKHDNYQDNNANIFGESRRIGKGLWNVQPSETWKVPDRMWHGVVQLCTDKKPYPHQTPCKSLLLFADINPKQHPKYSLLNHLLSVCLYRAKNKADSLSAHAETASTEQPHIALHNPH